MRSHAMRRRLREAKSTVSSANGQGLQSPAALTSDLTSDPLKERTRVIFNFLANRGPSI
jgi:hypothetical protein